MIFPASDWPAIWTQYVLILSGAVVRALDYHAGGLRLESWFRLVISSVPPDHPVVMVAV